MPLPALIRAIGDEAPAEVRRAAAGTAARLGTLREHRRRTGEPDREALDLLPGGHGLPPDLRAGQREPALQSAGRLRTDLRDHLLRRQAAAGDGDALIERCIEDCHKVGFFTAGRPDLGGQPGRHARSPTWSTTTTGPRNVETSSATGCRRRTSSWPGATPNGSTTTRTTRSSPARRPRSRWQSFSGSSRYDESRL